MHTHVVDDVSRQAKVSRGRRDARGLIGRLHGLDALRALAVLGMVYMHVSPTGWLNALPFADKPASLAWVESVVSGRAMLAMFYGGAFEDGRYQDSTWFANGSTVMNEFTFLGTHTGDLGQIPATGRSVELPMMSIYHVEDGHIQRARLYYDSATLLRQLGVIE